MLYIIAGCYKPNIAATMRLLSLVKGLSVAGADFRLVFTYPNENFATVDRKEELGNVCYLWKSHPIGNRYLKYLRSFYDVSRYVSKLPKGSIVILINANEYLTTVVRYKKTISVYVESNEYPLLEGLMPSFLQKRYIKSCPKVDGLFVISTALREYYEGIGVKNVKIINMVVEPSRFQHLNKSEKGEKYIAYCGSATNNKDGVDILIKSFALISKKNNNYKLYVIGKTPAFTDDQTNLQLVKDLGIEDKVVFTGEISSERVPQLLVDASLLVLARPDNLQSHYGFPTKLGEYLLTGNPVVVTAVGDIPLFLTDGESALIARPGDENNFATKMLWAIEHPVEAKDIGSRGRDVALSVFNGSIEALKILSMIRESEQ